MRQPTSKLIKRNRLAILGLALFLPALAACGAAEPTATPTAASTATAAPPVATATAIVTQVTLVTATMTATATMTENLASLGDAVVAKVSDDAVAFVLAKGPANVTADQLTAAFLGVLGRLQRWVDDNGGDTALADCQALLPGVSARAGNHAPIDALLAACASGDKAAVSDALQAFASIMP